MTTRTIMAPAKLNLTLDILNRRDDGYHDIKTIMQTIALFDELTLTIEEASETSISCSCVNADDFPDIKWDEKNLICKAALAFLSATKISAKITVSINKQIPSGAGMGGGSSDAAAILKALNNHFGQPCSYDELLSIGTSLGADVPFLISGGTALCEGIGEKLTPYYPISDIYIVVAKPQASISTKYLYEAVDEYMAKISHPDQSELMMLLERGLPVDIDSLSKALCNFFEPAAEEYLPTIKTLKETLINAGAEASIMTGSGSAVFGIFKNKELAETAYQKLNCNKDNTQYFLTYTI